MMKCICQGHVTVKVTQSPFSSHSLSRSDSNLVFHLLLTGQGQQNPYQMPNRFQNREGGNRYQGKNQDGGNRYQGKNQDGGNRYQGKNRDGYQGKGGDGQNRYQKNYQQNRYQGQ